MLLRSLLLVPFLLASTGWACGFGGSRSSRVLDYRDETNHLADQPEWYNALTHNCTTTIRRHVQHVAPGNPWNWRILVNGRIDEFGYLQKTIDTSLPFEELRQRRAIAERAKAADADPGFSARIREGLPGRPGAP
jgi:hypothetical protein